jgi:nitrogen fixation protein FixH
MKARTPGARAVDSLSTMLLLATDEATSHTIGLLITFIGIGIIVNVILIYIAIQIRGERRQNQEYMAAHGPNGAKDD